MKRGLTLHGVVAGALPRWRRAAKSRRRMRQRRQGRRAAFQGTGMAVRRARLEAGRQGQLGAAAKTRTQNGQNEYNKVN